MSVGHVYHSACSVWIYLPSRHRDIATGKNAVEGPLLHRPAFRRLLLVIDTEDGRGKG